jgi:2'-5' RNA ligase
MTNGGPDASSRINSFALVAYIHGPLAGFIDSLREELVPGCLSIAHVTVLPPRPLAADPANAFDFISARLRNYSAFPIEAVGLRVFPVTDVIYAEIGEGSAELLQLHRMLNCGVLEFSEPFEYHPHLTLAQGLQPGQLPALLEAAERRWREYRQSHSGRFLVEKLTFVQNTAENRWIDLESWDLDPRPAVYSR